MPPQNPYASQPFPAYPPPPPKKSNRNLIIGLAAAGGALMLLICCGGLYAIGANEQQKNKAAADTSAPSTPAPTASSAAPTPTPAPASAPPSATAAAVRTVTMPNVVGKNAAVAYDELQELGITEIQLGSQDANDTLVLWPANWTVTKQSAKAGTKVRTDKLIVITCTKK